MRIFLFEFITGGGWFLVDNVEPPAGSLLNEGRAMAKALAEDFTGVGDVQLTSLIDARLNDRSRPAAECSAIENAADLKERFIGAAAAADFTLVIAPEFDNHLANLSELVIEVGGRLLSSSPAFVRLASDKQATADLLRKHSISAPQGMLLEPNTLLPPDFPLPAVTKPNDGAGSMSVRLVQHASDFKPCSNRLRLESFHKGHPVSIAAICGPNGFTLLPPCQQHLSDDGCFTYHGGMCPVEEQLAVRAKRLAQAALDALPATSGYVGIDMVLGDNSVGDGDVVIEVNPRLTTSYVGLRKAMRQNLAKAMLQAVLGEAFELSVGPGKVKFAADGSTYTLVE